MNGNDLELPGSACCGRCQDEQLLVSCSVSSSRRRAARSVSGSIGRPCSIGYLQWSGPTHPAQARPEAPYWRSLFVSCVAPPTAVRAAGHCDGRAVDAPPFYLYRTIFHPIVIAVTIDYTTSGKLSHHVELPAGEDLSKRCCTYMMPSVRSRRSRTTDT